MSGVRLRRWCSALMDPKAFRTCGMQAKTTRSIAAWSVEIACVCLFLAAFPGCALMSQTETSWGAAIHLEDVLAYGLSLEEVRVRLGRAGYELRRTRDAGSASSACYAADYEDHTVAWLCFEKDRLRHLKIAVDRLAVGAGLMWSDGVLWCSDPVLARPEGTDLNSLLQDYVRVVSRLGYQSIVYSNGWMRVYSHTATKPRSRVELEHVPTELDEFALYDTSDLLPRPVARVCVGNYKLCAFATRESTRKRCRVFLRDEDIDWVALERVRAEFDRIRPDIERALNSPRGRQEAKRGSEPAVGGGVPGDGKRGGSEPAVEGTGGNEANGPPPGEAGDDGGRRVQ
jgi:hypothetical protein